MKIGVTKKSKNDCFSQNNATTTSEPAASKFPRDFLIPSMVSRLRLAWSGDTRHGGTVSPHARLGGKALGRDLGLWMGDPRQENAGKQPRGWRPDRASPHPMARGYREGSPEVRYHDPARTAFPSRIVHRGSTAGSTISMAKRPACPKDERLTLGGSAIKGLPSWMVGQLPAL